MSGGFSVAVLEPYPLLARAICGALSDAGYDATPLDSPDQLRATSVDWVVWAVDDVADLAAFTAARPDVPVVVLRDRANAVSAPVLLMVGAVGIVERGGDPTAVVLALEAPSRGLVVIPYEVRDEVREGFHPLVLERLSASER